MIRNETERSHSGDRSQEYKTEIESACADNVASSKKDLRAFLSHALRLQPLSPWSLCTRKNSDRAAFAHAFDEKAWALFIAELKSANAIGLYAPVSEWAEAQNLEKSLKTLLGKDCPKFAYPRSAKSSGNSRDMEFAICTLNQTTREGLKSRAAPAVATAVIPEIIFVPGTCMDSLGNRLGRGMGFYDRYLLKHSKARRIGTIHSRFVVEEFSNNWIEEHDQLLEVLWTETGIYQTPNFRLAKNKEQKS